MPTEDICRMFNILVKTMPFSSGSQVFDEVFKRLRSNIHGIPKEFFCQTMYNLIEVQNPHIAEKAVKMILMQIPNFPSSLLDTFQKDKERI
jgi:hypothetical protein